MRIRPEDISDLDILPHPSHPSSLFAQQPFSMGKVMIYGATGYTGGLMCIQAKKAGLDFILAGRTHSLVQSAATQLDVPYRVFDVNTPELLDSSLDGILTLLNCAGPFARTAEPLVEACLRTGVHYLDTSAELGTYLLAEQYDSKAKAANVMLMPGCGGSVAIFGCLVARALEKLDNVQQVDLALHVSGPMSRGSAITAMESSNAQCMQRLDGRLAIQDSTSTALFDFADGRGAVGCFPVTLPDIVTVHKSFGVSNIRTFANASGTAFPNGDLAALPDGPTAEEKNANPYHAAIAVTLVDGSVHRSVLRLVNGYTLIAKASVEAARRVADDDYLPGFQTSATVFGAGFMESVPGVLLDS
jgi:short subunit dehydrogenase-like uncharacterized protein